MHAPQTMHDLGARGREAKARQAALSPLERVQNARLDLSPTQEAAVADRVSQMPETCRANYLRALRGKSLAAGVKAFCLECTGWNRQAARECTSPACPLHPYRPCRCP